MNIIIQTILPFLLLYKYGALFLITFIAALILPIPPGTLIMGASALAYEGYLHFTWVIIVATLGNIIGDNVGYWLARKYGHPFLYRIGFRKVLESHRYKTLEVKIKHRPGFIIFISRFEVFANLSVNLMCGLAKVPYRKYLIYEVLGESVQVALYGTLGYVFGGTWQSLNALIGRSILIVTILFIIFVILFWKKISRKLFRDSHHT